MLKILLEGNKSKTNQARLLSVIHIVSGANLEWNDKKSERFFDIKTRTDRGFVFSILVENAVTQLKAHIDAAADFNETLSIVISMWSALTKEV